MLADRVMRGEEGPEFKTRHWVSLRTYCSCVRGTNYGAASAKAIAESRQYGMVVVRCGLAYRRPEFLWQSSFKSPGFQESWLSRVLPLASAASHGNGNP
jgi:hypothetical protein